MNTIQSPQYSNSNKADLFSKQRSPSFRNKRIPSVQDNVLCFSSHNIKSIKNDSPSKHSEEIRRRKSQIDSHQLNNSNSKKKSKNISCGNKDLLTSIQDLKQEYKVLREAYKEIVHERMKNVQEINNMIQQNQKLKGEVESYKLLESTLSGHIAALNNKIQGLNSEIKAERRINSQLQREIYFLKEKYQSKDKSSNGLNEINHLKAINKGNERKMVIDEDLELIQCKSFSSQSNILSFSLTSVLEQSLSQSKTGRRREHVKVVSDLSHCNGDFQNLEIKPKKDSIFSNANFKKSKKQCMKLEATAEVKQSKALSIITPSNHLLALKSPMSSEKKMIKNLNFSNSKKKKEDKQNVQIKTSKKKSKKGVLQIISND